MEAAIGRDGIERHVPGLWLDVRHTLEVIRHPDEFRASPLAIAPSMAQVSIIEAGTAPQAPAARVDRDQRQQHCIELPRLDAALRMPFGFLDSKAVATKWLRGLEPHEFHGTARDVRDHGEIKVAPSAQGEGHERREVYLARIREIHGNACTRSQETGSRDDTPQCRGSVAALPQGERAALLAHGAPHRIAIIRIRSRQRRIGRRADVIHRRRRAAPPACAVGAIALDTEQ